MLLLCTVNTKLCIIHHITNQKFKIFQIDLTRFPTKPTNLENVNMLKMLNYQNSDLTPLSTTALHHHAQMFSISMPAVSQDYIQTCSYTNSFYY